MGTHLRELSESYAMNTNMTGFEWFPKVLVLSTKVVSAFELFWFWLAKLNHEFRNYNIGSRVVG